MKNDNASKLDKLDSRAQAEEVVNKAIQEVAFNYNAFVPIISAFRVAYTDIVPTMGVDKYARLIVNPDFIADNSRYGVGLLIHEILHVFFGHTTGVRGELVYTDNERRNTLINIAEDCAINQFINEPLPEGHIAPSALSNVLGGVHVPMGQTAEFYFDLIMEHLPENEGAGLLLNNPSCSTDIANATKVQDALDKMGIKHLSQEEIADKRLEMAAEISKSPGYKYGRLAGFARELLEPKVDWRPLLQGTIRSAEKKVWNIHARSTYKRTSRRIPTSAILVPKKYGHKLSVSLSFDTSGSISADMVNQFLPEVGDCMRYSEIKECALWHTSVYWYGTPAQLEQDIEKVFEEGGTSGRCIEECAKHCETDLGFAFTDGEWDDDPQKPEDCKINSMVAIIWDGTEIKEIRKLW